MLRNLFAPRPTTTGDTLRRQRRYWRHAHRTAQAAARRAAHAADYRPGRPDLRTRPTIIANLTAVGIPGYLDIEDQPTGTVRTPTGLALTAWALRSR